MEDTKAPILIASHPKTRVTVRCKNRQELEIMTKHHGFVNKTATLVNQAVRAMIADMVKEEARKRLLEWHKARVEEEKNRKDLESLLGKTPTQDPA